MEMQKLVRFVRVTSEYLTGLAEGVQDEGDHGDFGSAIKAAQQSVELLERLTPYANLSRGGGVVTSGVIPPQRVPRIVEVLSSMRMAETPEALRQCVYNFDDTLISALEPLAAVTGNAELDEVIATEVQRVLGVLRAHTAEEREAVEYRHDRRVVTNYVRFVQLPNGAVALAGAWSTMLGLYVLWKGFVPEFPSRGSGRDAMLAAGVGLTLVGSVAVGIATLLPFRTRPANPPHPVARLFMLLGPFFLATLAFWLVAGGRARADTGAAVAATALCVGGVIIAIASALIIQDKERVVEASRSNAAALATGPWPLLSPNSQLTDSTAFLDTVELGIRRRILTESDLARRWNRANYVIGGLAALLAGLGGAAGLSDLSGAPKVTLAVLGLLGSGLAGIVTTLKAGANAEAADRRKVDYDALLLDLRRVRDRSGDQPVDAATVDDLVSRIQRISGATGIEQSQSLSR